jgi:hypothetical protein
MRDREQLTGAFVMKHLGVFALMLLLAAAISIFIWGRWRTRDARQFMLPRQVHTYSGTNYVFQLTDVTIGRLPSGYLVIVAARLENPNLFPVELARNWFVLVDGERDYYQPSTNGTQTAFIVLPPGGRIERELFSYHVSDAALGGVLAILAGHQHWVMVKEKFVYKPTLRDGEFVTFQRANW